MNKCECGCHKDTYLCIECCEGSVNDSDQSLKRELVEALEESRQFTCGYSEKTFDSHGLRKHYEKVKALIARAEAQDAH